VQTHWPIESDDLKATEVLYFRYVGLIQSLEKSAMVRYEQEHVKGDGGTPLIRMLLLCKYKPVLQCMPFTVEHIRPVQQKMISASKSCTFSTHSQSQKTQFFF